VDEAMSVVGINVAAADGVDYHAVAAADLSAAHGDDRAWLGAATRVLDDAAASGARPDWAVLAGQVGMSADQFAARFVRLTGMPPARFLATRVLDRAAALLVTSRRSLRDIAHACGFCDQFDFSRRFKQTYGIAPTAYRRTRAMLPAPR
jgi:transcriptional regulator GlxA family with amidase domain